MNNFIKIIFFIVIMFLFNNCGDNNDKNSDTKTYNNHTSKHISKGKTIHQDSPKDNESENNQEEKSCSQLLERDLNSIVIVGSFLECAPHIELYHAEVQPTYFKYLYDESYKGYTIFFKSNGLENAIHILGYDAKERYEWDEYPEYQNKFNLSWDSKFSNDFYISVVLSFMDGNISKKTDLIYSPSKNGYERYTNGYCHISLGESAKDGQWHHFERNILSDLKRFYPNATMHYNEDSIVNFSYINGFALRGTGSITNIILKR